MKIEDFDKIKNSLEKSKKENNDKIGLSDERRRMSDVNTFEYQALITSFFSLVGYMPLLLISTILIKVFGVGIITNVMSPYLFPIVLLSGSVGIGYLWKNSMHKKYKTKERFLSFSKAKNEDEIVEEKIYYEIEQEKAMNRNKAIDEAIRIVNDNQSLMKRASKRYDIREKNTSVSKLDGLSEIVKKQYEKLDILSTKKVLHERFFRTRSKYQRIADSIVASTTTALCSMFCFAFPLMTLMSGAFVGSAINPGLVATLGSFGICVVGGPLYINARSKAYNKIFKKFNDKLGDEALPLKLDDYYEMSYDEMKSIDEEIKKLISDLSLNIALFEEVKLKEEETDILFQDFPQLKVTEQTRQNVLEHPELHQNCDVRTRMGKFYTNEEYEQHRDEILSTPLPGEDGPTLSMRKK